jgi:hypothetical protein
MKKSLLVWGVLIALALCFVGCCYYTTHCSHGTAHCHCKQECKSKACPADANDDDTVETMTVEAVEIVPVGGNQGKTPAAGHTTTPAPAAKASPAAPAPATK